MDINARTDPPVAGTTDVITDQPKSGVNDHTSNAMEAIPTSAPMPIPHRLTIRLYTSHFLSTWNSRLFEFAAVLFLASIFPGTLLPMSVYALARSAAAIVFAQAVGSWIDSGNRLTVVQTSIIGQRVAVAASCAIFLLLEQRRWEGRLKSGLFAVTVLLACVEKICSVMNLVSVERDWVSPFLSCSAI
jgi:iron-regulated transporter 1